ncbi:MAG: cation:proton antiporter [Pseudomonadales bacterium]
MLLTLGGLFAIGLLADLIGRFTPLPRVTVLIGSGIVIGPAMLAIVPASYVAEWFPTLTAIALTMVGFLLGQGLTLNEIQTRGRASLWLAIAKVVGSAMVVFTALWLLGIGVIPAILLSGIAAATDPAATFDVVRESASDGPFTRTLLRIVALDDALALMLFALLIALAKSIADWNSTDSGALHLLLAAPADILGSLCLGIVLGVPMAYLTGRIESADNAGEPILAEALGFVLICAGCAQYLGLSEILAAMAMGSTVATLAKHHSKPFAAIEGIEWPFMILFFILAGASLTFSGVALFGAIAAAYVVARSIGATLGVYSAAVMLNAAPSQRHWLGPALLPQAGVAIGMALIAAQAFPEHAALLLTCTLLSTVVLELLAPIVTRAILVHVREAGSGALKGDDSARA